MSSVAVDLQPGSVLSGVYRIDGKIGQGVHGAVYRAMHRYIGPVALKVFFEPTDSEGLLREAALLAAVNHPGIVRVFDAGVAEIGGRQAPYLSMEHLPLGSLGALLRERGRLPVTTALDVTHQILGAIGHMQALDPPVIHRDVIPENVLVAAHSPLTVKVGDFSMALAVPASVGLTLLEESVIAYLPPESAHGYYPASADLYAVGVMLYLMLTGVPPFPALPSRRGASLRAVLAERRTPPPLPSVYRPRVGPGVDALLMRALAPTPSERFPDAPSFAAAVRAIRGLL